MCTRWGVATLWFKKRSWRRPLFVWLILFFTSMLLLLQLRRIRKRLPLGCCPRKNRSFISAYLVQYLLICMAKIDTYQEKSFQFVSICFFCFYLFLTETCTRCVRESISNPMVSIVMFCNPMADDFLISNINTIWYIFDCIRLIRT